MNAPGLAAANEVLTTMADATRPGKLPEFQDAHYKRVRGQAPWKPYAKTKPWLEAVLAVLEAERAYWPVGARHVAYQLVGRTVGGLYVAKGTTPGAKKAWTTASRKVQEVMNRGRRCGLIPWAAVADEGAVASWAGGFDGPAAFWEQVRDDAEGYGRYLLGDQAVHVEVWSEAAGLVGALKNTAHRYGVPVFSGGGFDSTDVKYRAARRAIAAICDGKRFVALHVGDCDQAGHWLFGAIAEDVEAFVRDLLGWSAEEVADWVEIRRLAVIPEQIVSLGLPADPDTGNVQAEAVPAAVMAGLLSEALEALLDIDQLAATEAHGEAEREAILAQLAQLEDGVGDD